MRSNRRIALATFVNNQQNVDEGFDVIDDGRLTKQSHLRREWRFAAGLTSQTFNRVEQRRLLATDVGPGAAANLNVKINTAPKNILAQKPALAGGLDGVLQPLTGQRIFTAKINEAVLATDGAASDGHGFNERVRIAFHHDAVLKRVGFGFVGVADE